MTKHLFTKHLVAATTFNAENNIKQRRPTFVSGPEIIPIFEAKLMSKPMTWFSTASQDAAITMHGMWCAGWWLIVQDSKKSGIVACYGTDLSCCTCLARAKTVEAARQALTDLIALSEKEAEAILSASSIEDARELLRAVIGKNLPR